MARKNLKHSLASKTGKTSVNYPLIFGTILLFVFFGWRYHQARILSFNAKEIQKIEKRTGITPIHIKAYPVGVDIDIQEATILNGVWAVHPNSASYLVTSGGIGDDNNIILYGHNKDEIMGPIRHIKVGATIQIKGSDGKDYAYEVIKTDTVNPDNLEYLKPTESETLTIYTCIGLFDSQRFIVVAKRN